MIKNQLMNSLKKEGRTQLTEVEAKILLKEIGIPVVRTKLAYNKKEAISISKEIGFPIVMKIVSPDITHKSDVGGVKLDLRNYTQVDKAYTEMMSTIKSKFPQARIEGVSIQRMAPPGVEVIIGMTKDPQFGSLLMFGLGGILVELMKDVSFRIVPVGKKDAREMIEKLKGFPLLKGYRGREPVDTPFLEEMIVRVSEFIEKSPELQELDINPILAYGKGAIAVDARILLEPFS
jgi:acyl-CoA synthetase (NDP forming)